MLQHITNHRTGHISQQVSACTSEFPAAVRLINVRCTASLYALIFSHQKQLSSDWSSQLGNGSVWLRYCYQKENGMQIVCWAMWENNPQAQVGLAYVKCRFDLFKKFKTAHNAFVTSHRITVVFPAHTVFRAGDSTAAPTLSKLQLWSSQFFLPHWIYSTKL